VLEINWKRYLPVLVFVMILVSGYFIFDDSSPPPADTAGGHEDLNALGANSTIGSEHVSPDESASEGNSEKPASVEDSMPSDEAFSSNIFWMLIQFLLIFGGICGLAWLSLRWLLPKLYGSRGVTSSQIQLVDTYRFDSRRSLMLVEVRGKSFLLAGSEQGIKLLARLDDRSEENTEQPPLAEEETPGETLSFESTLRKGK